MLHSLVSECYLTLKPCLNLQQRHSTNTNCSFSRSQGYIKDVSKYEQNMSVKTDRTVFMSLSKQTIREVTTLTSEAVANGLNLVASYGAEMLRAAGIDGESLLLMV